MILARVMDKNKAWQASGAVVLVTFRATRWRHLNIMLAITSVHFEMSRAVWQVLIMHGSAPYRLFFSLEITPSVVKLTRDNFAYGHDETKNQAITAGAIYMSLGKLVKISLAC